MNRFKKYISLVVAIFLFASVQLVASSRVELTHSFASSNTLSSESSITVVPSAEPASGIWNASNEQNAIRVDHIALNGDLWDIGSDSSGYVSMNDQSSLQTDVNFSSVDYGANGQQVIGYPNVGYGFSAFGNGSSEWNDPALSLPTQLSNLPNIIALANYSTDGEGGITPYNFAYDLWMTQSEPNGSTNSAPSTGDLELMVWTDSSNGLSPYCVLIFCTESPEGTVVQPAYFNGINQNLTWNVWISNGNQDQSHQTIVFFILNNPVANGTVGIDINEMVQGMENALLSDYTNYWAPDFQNYWFDYISLGSEFQPGLLGSAQYSWNLSNYCLLIDYPSLTTSSSTYSCPSTDTTSTSTDSTTASSNTTSTTVSTSTGSRPPSANHYDDYLAIIILADAVALTVLAGVLLRARNSHAREVTKSKKPN